MKKVLALILVLMTGAAMGDTDGLGYLYALYHLQLYSPILGSGATCNFGLGSTTISGDTYGTQFGNGNTLTGFGTVNYGFGNNDAGAYRSQMFGNGITCNQNNTTFIGSSSQPQGLWILGSGTSTWGATNGASGNGWLFGSNGFYFAGASLFGSATGLSNIPQTAPFAYASFTNQTVSTNVFITNTFGGRITVYGTMTNTALAGYSEVFAWQSNGTPVTPGSPVSVVPFSGGSIETNTFTLNMSPGEYFSVSNSLGIIQFRTNVVQRW